MHWPAITTYERAESDSRVWHYTSIGGAGGIIETASIRTTDVLFLNDSSEFVHGLGPAKEYIEELKSAATTDLKKAKAQWVLDRLDAIDEFTRVHVYVASFSTQADALSQWRAYARGGGLAIGFDLESLRHNANAHDFDLVECLYEPEAQRRAVMGVVDRDLAPWLRHVEPWDVNAHDKSGFAELGALGWSMARLAPRLEHPTFHAEREWRLVSRPESVLRRDSQQQRPSFREQRGLPVPYVPLPIAAETWATASVVLSPSARPLLQESAVHSLPASKGILCGIFRSGSPYREQ